VAGDVADDQGQRAVLTGGHEVEEVAADLLAGQAFPGHGQLAEMVRAPGGEVLHDLSGQGQGALLLGQVGDEGHVAEGSAAGVGQGVGVDQHGHGGAVRPDVAALEDAHRQFAQPVQVGPQEALVLGVGQIDGGQAEELVAVPAGQAAEGGVHVGDAQLGVEEHEALGRGLDDPPELLLAFAQLLLGPHALGHVGHDALVEEDVAGLVPGGGGHVVDPAHLAGTGQDAVGLLVVGLSGPLEDADLRVHAGHVVGVDEIGEGLLAGQQLGCAVAEAGDVLRDVDQLVVGRRVAAEEDDRALLDDDPAEFQLLGQAQARKGGADRDVGLHAHA